MFMFRLKDLARKGLMLFLNTIVMANHDMRCGNPPNCDVGTERRDNANLK